MKKPAVAGFLIGGVLLSYVSQLIHFTSLG
jgi:hypothetical protein